MRLRLYGDLKRSATVMVEAATPDEVQAKLDAGEYEISDEVRSKSDEAFEWNGIVFDADTNRELDGNTLKPPVYEEPKPKRKRGGLYKTTITVWSRHQRDSESLVEVCAGITASGDCYAFRNGSVRVENPQDDPDGEGALDYFGEDA
jgi:hypothetical protein